MMTRRGYAGLALGGTVALAGWIAVGSGTFKAPHIEKAAASIAERGPTPPEPAVVTTAAPVSDAATDDAKAPESVVASAGASAAEVPAVEPVLAEPAPKPPSETGMQLASVPPPDQIDEALK